MAAAEPRKAARPAPLLSARLTRSFRAKNKNPAKSRPSAPLIGRAAPRRVLIGWPRQHGRRRVSLYTWDAAGQDTRGHRGTAARDRAGPAAPPASYPGPRAAPRAPHRLSSILGCRAACAPAGGLGAACAALRGGAWGEEGEEAFLADHPGAATPHRPPADPRLENWRQEPAHAPSRAWAGGGWAAEGLVRMRGDAPRPR